MTVKCPSCQQEKALIDNEYGVLPGVNCQNEVSNIPKPTQKATYDFASPITKQQRKEYAKSMLQPYTGDGILSREYVEAWGIDKLAGVTKQDVKNSKYVYGNMTRHHKMQNSKI